MEYKWMPKEHFKGHIVLDLYKRKERLDLVASLGVKANAEGEVELSNDSIEAADKIDKMVKSRIKQVELESLECNMKFKSLDDLEYYEEYDWLIGELGSIVLRGVSLGNVPKRV